MANDNGGGGGIGILGVLIGAFIVVMVGAGVLYATGNLGNSTSVLKIEAPKVAPK
jgi:membrane protein DedA with SNARE-associated domain